MEEMHKNCFLFFSSSFFPLKSPPPRVLSWIPHADREVQNSRRVHGRGSELGLRMRGSFPEEVSYITSTEI